MSFGGWSISEICFNYIREILPDGSTILEFGSGFSTEQLSKYYTMYSVENYQEWVGKYDATYIYAPIRKYEIGGSDIFGDADFWTAPEDIPGEQTAAQVGWYDPDISGEDSKVQAIANATWTTDIKNAYETWNYGE